MSTHEKKNHDNRFQCLQLFGNRLNLAETAKGFPCEGQNLIRPKHQGFTLIER